MATNLPFTGVFRVTCEYGRKGSWKAGYHTGIDLVGETSKIVYATCNGVISRTGFDKSYGNFVVIKADNGNYHWLCHLASISVSVGDRVSRVNKVGIMGNTGRTTGPHTHFEIRDNSNKYGNDLNPAEYIGIPNQIGTYNSKDFQIVETVETVEYFPTCNKNVSSIVDALKSIGVDSSMANRKAIAVKNNINDYKGTAEQNIELLNKLKSGKLIK